MKWRALILGGGGSTGEFQMGVLPVIAAHYDRFDMYIGIGVGALHSSVLAQHDRFSDGVQVLLNFWRGIRKTSDLFDVPLLGSEIGTLSALASEQGWARDSIYGNKKLRRLIGEHVDWKFLNGKNNWAVEITSLSDGRLYVITNHNELLKHSNNTGHRLTLSLDPANKYYIGSHLIDFVTASGSVPLSLPPVDIFEHRFVEGGLRDFTPLQLAVKVFELERPHRYD
jgi:NTE family protein